MKKICLMLILVFVLLPCVACNEELPPVNEVVDNMVEAMDEVETLRQDTNVTMQLYFTAEDMPSFFPLDLDIELNAASVHDKVNNNSEAVIDMVITGADGDSVKMNVALYLVDSTMYVMADYPLLNPMWTKSEIPRMYLREMNDYRILEQLLQMMDIKVTGTERKEGTNCYVLKVTPDISRIFGSFMLPADYETEYSEPDLEIMEEIFRDFSMKLWVAHDTYRLVYGDISMKIEVSPETMDVYDEEGLFSLDIAIKTHYHHYNSSVEIDLPTEAENADEGSLW